MRPVTHLAACEALSRRFPADPAIRCLPTFSALADAGIEMMERVAEQISFHGMAHVRDIASQPGVVEQCARLYEAARIWLQTAPREVRHIDSAYQFAETFTSSRPSECLLKLVQHHERFGGGQRWFIEHDGVIEQRIPPHGVSSRYRFRLWPLCRLGVQCGVLRTMPQGLIDEIEDGDGE